MTATRTDEAEAAAALERRIMCAERRGYRRGVEHARQYTRRLLICMTATNRSLLDMVRVIDLDFPIRRVILPVSMAEKVLTFLQQNSADVKLVAELQGLIERANGEWALPSDAVQEELAELVG